MELSELGNPIYEFYFDSEDRVLFHVFKPHPLIARVRSVPKELPKEYMNKLVDVDMDKT